MHYAFAAIGTLIGLFIAAVVIGSLLAILGVIVTIGCFAGAFFLARHAFETIQERNAPPRPPPSPSPSPSSVTAAELSTPLTELSASSKENYAEARRALIKTRTEWNSISRHHGNRSFLLESDLELYAWPLDSDEVRAATIHANQVLSENMNPVRMLGHTQAANALDLANLQLRTAIGNHIGKALTVDE